MMSSFKCQQWQCRSSVRSSASFEEASQYGLGRLGFSDLSLKDEQCLSIRAVYKATSVFMWLLALGRACVSFCDGIPLRITNLAIPELRCAGSFSPLNNPHRSIIGIILINKISQAEEVAHEIYNLCLFLPLFHARARAWGLGYRYMI